MFLAWSRRIIMDSQSQSNSGFALWRHRQEARSEIWTQKLAMRILLITLHFEFMVRSFQLCESHSKLKGCSSIWNKELDTFVDLNGDFQEFRWVNVRLTWQMV